MLFENKTEIQKFNYTKPIQSFIQFIVIGVVGLFAYINNTEHEKVKIPFVVSASPLEIQIESVLSNSSLKEKEKIYKVFSGISEYAKNSERTQSNRQVEEMISEVIATYKLEEFTGLDPIIQAKVKEAGLEKDVKLAENKDKIILVFDELAEAVKKSIEKTINTK